MDDTDEESLDSYDESEYAYNDEVTTPDTDAPISKAYHYQPDKFLNELISKVKKYPLLYDNTISRNPNKMQTRRKIWAQIAKKMSFPVDGEYCKLRWTRLRMVLTRILRVHREQVQKGILPPDSEPHWMYYKSLRYLVPHMRIYGQRTIWGFDDQDYVLPRHARDVVPARFSTSNREGPEQEYETIEIDDDDDSDDVANCDSKNAESEPAPSIAVQREENSLNSVKIVDIKCKQDMLEDEKHTDKPIVNNTKPNTQSVQEQIRYMGGLESDELLIQAIKKYPILYTSEGKTQDIRLSRQAKWRQVVKQLGIEEQAIKNRWVILKRQFLYILKKDPRRLKPCDVEKNKWLVDQMKFLTPHLRNTHRNHMLRRHILLYEWLKADADSKGDDPVKEEVDSSSNTDDIKEEDIKEEDVQDDDSSSFSDDEAEDFVLTSFLTNVLKKPESRVNNRNAVDVAEDELSCYTNFFSG